MRTTFTVTSQIAKMLRIGARLRGLRVQDAVEEALVDWCEYNIPDKFTKKDLMEDGKKQKSNNS